MNNDRNENPCKWCGNAIYRGFCYYIYEEALSKQAVLQVQKYEGEKVKESNVDEIIQKAIRKKRDSRDVR